MSTLHLVDPPARETVTATPPFHPAPQTVEDFPTLVAGLYARAWPQRRA